MSKSRPETELEAYEYFLEMGGDRDDADDFLDRMEAIGWVWGKARHPIVCWKAAARTHMRNKRRWAAEKQIEQTPNTKFQRMQNALRTH